MDGTCCRHQIGRKKVMGKRKEREGEGEGEESGHVSLGGERAGGKVDQAKERVAWVEEEEEEEEGRREDDRRERGGEVIQSYRSFGHCVIR